MTSVKNDADMQKIGERLGAVFRGGEVIELVGDVGAGKTTLVKGMGTGLAIEDDVQSPSFTISRVYGARDDLELRHYDFYRLQDAGVMQYELAESIVDHRVITVIEWAETVQQVLPRHHTRIQIDYTPDGEGRVLDITTPKGAQYLKEAIT